ncbi:MAG: SDR family NAD(P)-dependent oxidoreductase [Pseudomonadota bacterium]
MTQTIDLNNRNVVITGGATGIGFALAKGLGATGCRVMIAEPDEGRLQSATDTLKELGVDADYCLCDVTELAQVEALAEAAWERFGRVDMIFNNAGVGLRQVPIVDTDMDELRAMFEVNFFGVWHGCKVFGRRFIDQGTPAAIFNTGSENSLFNAVPNNGGYLAAKHAVLGMTDNLREQMPDHVHVGLIIPGFVKSGLTAAVAKLAMDTDEYAAIVLKQIADGRFYIVSHAYNIEHIDNRYQEIAESYASYAPRYEGDEEYDVRHLLANMGR